MDKRILLVDLAIAWVPLFVLKKLIQVKRLVQLYMLVEQCLIKLLVKFSPLSELTHFSIYER